MHLSFFIGALRVTGWNGDETRSLTQRLYPGPGAASALAACSGLRSPCVICVCSGLWALAILRSPCLGLGPSLLRHSGRSSQLPQQHLRLIVGDASSPLSSTLSSPPLLSSCQLLRQASPDPQAHTEPSPASLGASNTLRSFPASPWHLPQSLRAPGTFPGSDLRFGCISKVLF